MTFKVPDMSCEHCVKRITTALEAVPGVGRITITLNDKLVETGGTAGRDAVIKAIGSAGYTATPLD
jgi:copper chaperone CopZ